MLIKCKYCGFEFRPIRSTAVYCSTECRVAYHRHQKELDRQIDDGHDQMLAHIRKISNLLNDPDRHDQALLVLVDIRNEIESVLSMRNSQAVTVKGN